MSTKTVEELLDEAQKVSSVIATARRLIAEGKTVDLSNMEGKISALCENAEAAGLEDSSAITTSFSAIIQDLDLLNKEMSDLAWTTAEQSLEETANRAIDAYSRDDGES